ncbi:MAG: YidC/Oxa1 family membrane protein insertase [Clostridiales bacterium]|nr:YidC/Oxa1 family membrane protein insertase [Clostridiales bacterium]
MGFMGLISQPFGALLLWLNNFTGNYGAALIVFTLIVRIILLPLTVKQQKSMLESQKLQPHLAQIKEKYKNDKEKLNEETMKLYKAHNVNPAGGCLPLLIQLPIILGLYQVIIKPLTHMFKLTADQINLLMEKVNQVLTANGGQALQNASQFEIKIAQNLTPDILRSAGIDGVDIINFNFLGLNLGDTPSFAYINLLWIIPVLAYFSTFFSTKVTTAMSGNAQPDGGAASSMKTMNMIFPLMTAWFAFTMPAGVGLYWIIGNVIQMGQQVLLNYYFRSKRTEEVPLVTQTAERTKERKPKKGGGRKK